MAPERERDQDTGRFVGEFPDEDFLDAIRGADGPMGTGEVANAVECAHDTAYTHLRELRERGRVTSRKVGNTLLWSIVDD